MLGAAVSAARTVTLSAARRLASIRQVASTMYSTVFVLGGPGAGKGTQCEKIVKEYGYVHLSAGELLREARESGSEDGELIANHIQNGQIVPVEITIRLIQAAMAKSGGKNFLVDGFPRNRDNLDGWFRHMEGKSEVEFVLFFECSEQVCLARAMKRGETSQRTDDNIESFRKRYYTYINSTQPIIKYFADRGMVRTVSANGSVEEIFNDVRRVLEQAGHQPVSAP